MSRRVGQPTVVFDQNTVYLDFPRSDGDETKCPTNTTRVVDAEGNVNFMELLDIDTHGQAKKWRAAVGRAIATKLEMPGNPDNYVLRNWPQGYRLYDHHKGPAQNPRHDLYLFGCMRSGRFRSINEFIPHAIWLFSDPQMNYANCECKYCTKQPQRNITASMGDILGSPSSISPSPRLQKERAGKGRPRNTRPYAAVQKVLKPVKTLKLSAHIQDSPTLAERNSDLRAVFSRTSMKLKRWYRDGEVVWCELQPPIPGPSGEDSTIVFWPGLVQEYKLKAVAVPREGEASHSDSEPQPPQPTPGPSSSQLPKNGDALEEGRGTIFERQDSSRFIVEQSTIYLIELFAVNKSIHFPDVQVIPYQAYIPPDDLIAALQAVPTELLDFDQNEVSQFNPCPGQAPPPFESAAAPYAVALQIASNLSQFFSVTDEWEFTYTLPPPAPVAPIAPNPNLPETSLESALNAASRINFVAATMINDSSSHPYRNLSSAQPDMPRADLDRLAGEVFGSGSNSKGITRTQTRFQGLWWGPERIWVDDFVRLKVPRRCLAPHGAQNISPPAGPSKKALEAYSVTGYDPSEIGAGARGVFMRIDTLFVVESVNKEGKKRKECRASGPLFELVDEDWEEVGDEGVQQHLAQLQTNGDAPSTARPTKPLPARAPSSGQVSTTLTPSHPPPQVLPQSQAASSSSIALKGSTTPNQLPLNYLPPQPPLGYSFRPILTPGHEAIVSLSLLSGRYYPTLLRHPLIMQQVRRAAEVPIEEGGILRYGHLWAIEGLNGGFHCSVDPDRFQLSRTKMLERADREAYTMLENHKRHEMENGNLEDEDVDMLKQGESENEGGGMELIPPVAQDRDGDVEMRE